MSGFVDLHSHWVPGVDDGVASAEEAAALLRGLAAIGFARVVATPHMRPGMFENTASALRAAFARVQTELGAERALAGARLPSGSRPGESWSLRGWKAL